MAVVFPDHKEDNLAQILARAVGITSTNILDSFKYTAKLASNIGQRTLE